MPIYDVYATRLRDAEKGPEPEVYVYHLLPQFLREQLALIFTECIGLEVPWAKDRDIGNNNVAWRSIANVLDREVESFYYFGADTVYQKCIGYLRTSDDLRGVLSLIETCCRVMERLGRNDRWKHGFGIKHNPAEGVEEVNHRFLEHGVGYQFESGQIIRADSQYVHSEIVKEALALLSDPTFAHANSEFMTAHGHLREGKLRDCNTAALRAMESTLKAICDARGWTYQPGDTVERLIRVVRENGLFPDYLGGYFDNLIGAMKAGLPKVRDKQGGHGAGTADPPVPEHVAAFSLHLAAANIVMLAKAHRALG